MKNFVIGLVLLVCVPYLRIYGMEKENYGAKFAALNEPETKPANKLPGERQPTEDELGRIECPVCLDSLAGQPGVILTPPCRCQIRLCGKAECRAGLRRCMYCQAPLPAVQNPAREGSSVVRPERIVGAIVLGLAGLLFYRYAVNRKD